MIDVQIGEFREHFTKKSELECKMGSFDGNNSGWNASTTGSDVWSAKNRLFLDYIDMSSDYDQALQTFAELTHWRRLCRNSNLHQMEQLEVSATDNDSDQTHVSTEAALTAIGESRVLTPVVQDNENSRYVRKAGKPSQTARLSLSCSPLDSSVAAHDEPANDTLLKTPAGFYDRLLPFSAPSIPSLFERDETSFSDIARSRCSSPESLSASSCNDDALSMSSDSQTQKCEEWSSIEETKMISSTPCPSPVAATEQKLVSDDESRLCDRVVCSVLSQVISDDFDVDTCLLDSCSDIEVSSVEDKSVVSDRSNTSSPDGRSMLNPLAPAFRVKTSESSKSSHVSNVHSPFATVCSSVPFSYVPQQHANSVAWSYYPAYFPTCQTRSSCGSRKTKQSAMHFTPLHNGTGVWTQYSDPVAAYGCSAMVYPSQWMYQQPVCIVPQSWIGFIKLGHPTGLPVNGQFPPTRKSRATATSASRKHGRGPA